MDEWSSWLLYTGAKLSSVLAAPEKWRLNPQSTPQKQEPGGRKKMCMRVSLCGPTGTISRTVWPGRPISTPGLHLNGSLAKTTPFSLFFYSAKMTVVDDLGEATSILIHVPMTLQGKVKSWTGVVWQMMVSLWGNTSTNHQTCLECLETWPCQTDQDIICA